MKFKEEVRLAVIFDIDGVLVDSYRVHFESWLALAKEHGTTITKTQFASLFGRTTRDIIGEIWRQDLPAQQIAAMDERKEALYREFLRRNFPVMDGALQLIDRLVEAEFALAVGSSGPPENVKMSLQGLGCAKAFSAVITGKDVTLGKPNPQVFLLAAERMGVEPSNCAVIEDAPAGISAALAGRMTAIALVGTAPAEKLSHAHLVVNSLRELTPKRIVDLIQTHGNP